ncbi:MAG: hypothetical protein HY901_31890 [Deltaproteobacteria bacterium]|nr:hypothetical protein [Deltaproteobacteria bacterium]
MAAENLGVRATFAGSAALYREAFSPVAAVAAGFALPYAALDEALHRWRLSWLEASQLRGTLQLLLGVVASVTMARLFVLISRGERPRAPGALWYAIKRWPEALPVTLLTSLIVSIGLLLLVLPGLVAALNLSLAIPLLAATDLNANQVMRRSRALVFGKRRRLVLVLGLAFCATSGLGAGLQEAANLACRSLAEPTGRLLVWFCLELALGLLDAALLSVLVGGYRRVLSQET